jgi:predicted nucleic acid-binding protein
LQLLNVLPRLYGEVLIPPAVADELAVPVSGPAGIDPRTIPFFRIQSPSGMALVDDLRARLGAGESQAIALAVELKADAVLMDGLDGRAAASKLGLTAIGVLGVLVQAKHAGLVKAVTPLVHRLIRELDFRVSEPLIREIERRAGE